MISVRLLSCFTIIVSAVPVYSNVLPSIQSKGGAPRLRPVEAANRNPEAQTQPLIVEQPQPGVPQQLGPQSGPQPVPSMPYHTWSPQGNTPMMIPLQLSLHGPQLANQATFQQGVFPSYGYFPMFSPQYRNQLPSSPYGFPMVLETPPPQNPANQPVGGQVLPAQTPSEAALPGGAAQPVQQLQQQNPQFVYMLQQSMNSPLGALSSEELEMAAKLSQLGCTCPTCSPTCLQDLCRARPPPGSQTWDRQVSHLRWLWHQPEPADTGAGRHWAAAECYRWPCGFAERSAGGGHCPDSCST
ncbi:unnamed protein product [Pleuronectes platessa]|uniref:Uncharacterized protein n=1 Tax=Pleuronectes platessa TaxID=8262 RepID=A0A9N7UL73_PLEPL|nr:unnamed protein product [Pleuronectes platessa]